MDVSKQSILKEFTFWDNVKDDKLVLSLLEQNLSTGNINFIKNKFIKCFHLVSYEKRSIDDPTKYKVCIYDLHKIVPELVKPLDKIGNEIYKAPYNRPLLIIDFKPTWFEQIYINKLLTDPINILYHTNENIVREFITTSDIIIYSNNTLFDKEMKKYNIIWDKLQFPSNCFPLLFKQGLNYELFYYHLE